MKVNNIKSEKKRFTSETHEKWKEQKEDKKHLIDTTIDTIKKGQHVETYDKNYDDKKSIKENKSSSS